MRIPSSLPRSIAVVTALLLATPPLARADDESDRKAAAAAVLDQLHSVDMVGTILPSILGQIKANVTHNDPDLVKEFDAYEPHLRAEAEATKPALSEKLTAVYAKTFTLDELHDMLAYYKSPVGQRIIATQGVVNHDMLMAARDWGIGLAQALAQDAATQLQGAGPAPRPDPSPPDAPNADDPKTDAPKP